MRRSKKEILENSGPIARYVRLKREELGYTQETLAERAGIGLRFLKELELGKKTVRLDKVQDVIHFLGGEISVKDRKVC